jgi:Methyltransferase domain
MAPWINSVLAVCGVRLVRNRTFDSLQAREASPPPDPVAETRQVLDAIADNSLPVGTAVLAALKDIRIAAQLGAAASSAEWLYANADRAPTYARRPELLEALIPLIPAQGDFAEFGVFKGAVTWFVRPRFPDRAYHAFDSWKGVPEAMSLAVSKFSFDLGGTVPDLPADTTIHAGWFEDTIPAWRARCPATVAFAYIDCDLYESVRTVLEGIADRVRPSSILVFDDWYNFPNWQAHSLRAANEWSGRHGISLEPLGFTVLEHSAAFRVAY